MGKKNKKKEKQAAQTQNQSNPFEAKNGMQMMTQTETQTTPVIEEVKQEVKEEVAPVKETEAQTNEIPEVPKTAEERAKEYQESAIQIHERFVSQFQAEEAELHQTIDMTGGEAQLKKKEAEELKKLEKIIKKENNDFEDLTSCGAGNSKQVHDRMVRSLENSKRVRKQLNEIRIEHSNIISDLDKSKSTIDANLKKKSMLAMICDQFLKQNFNCYLKHEQMLDDEKDKRSALAGKFQEKMNSLSENINSTKEERQREYEQNQEIRNKISKVIDEYKLKENNYKAKMEIFNVKVQQFQNSDQMKECDKEKKIYEGTAKNVQALSEEIQNYINKFNTVKEDIEERGQKFEQYKIEIESKRLQKQLLETEIQNVFVKTEMKDKIAQTIANEKVQMQKQVETMKNLAKALKVQL